MCHGATQHTMGDRYLPPRVLELVEAAGRRPHGWAEERIRRDARRFYADSKKARLRELLRGASRHDTDARRKLTNLASAEASRKKKQFVQERSFQALNRLCAAQRSLARAVAVLVAANERIRSDNDRLAAMLANAGTPQHLLLPSQLPLIADTPSPPPSQLPEQEQLQLPPAKIHECTPFDDLAPLCTHPFLDME